MERLPGFVLVLCALSFPAATRLYAAGVVSFQTIETIPCRVPERVKALARSPSGDFILVSSDGSTAFRLASDTGALDLYPLRGIPARVGSNLDRIASLDVDRSGNLYMPALWRGAGRSHHLGVFVFEREGTLDRVIELQPVVLARRIAIEPSGSIYVLGIDPAYFKSGQEPCHLVHRYGPDGVRTHSFSPCPSELDLRRPGDVRPGPDWGRLKAETDRGHLWIQDGSIYHVLPVSRRVRVFDSAGRMVRESVLTPPPTAADLLRGYGQQDVTLSGESVGRIWSAAAGGFVVQWLHTERRGNGQHNFPYLAVHDSSGSPVSRAATLPCKQCTPLAVDADGTVTFLRKTSPEGCELVTMRLSIAPE
jgi:hypothetical protein